MRIILSLIFLNLIRSCNLVDLEPTPNFSIQTDSGSYSVSNRLSVKATFVNNLGQEVNIYNAGCGFPSFILQKLANEQWIDAGGPVCIAVAVGPTKLHNGKSLEAVVGMYVENEVGSGTYRMKFSIGLGENHELIESRFLFSNIFRIIRQ